MLNDDFLDMIAALSDADARFLLVGGYAVGVHGHPRATKDLDLWAASHGGARSLCSDLTEDDLATPGIGFMRGRPPCRIDILTALPGLTFEAAWSRRAVTKFGGLDCPVISLEDLIVNERAVGRPQDLADADVLERIRVARS